MSKEKLKTPTKCKLQHLHKKMMIKETAVKRNIDSIFLHENQKKAKAETGSWYKNDDERILIKLP